MPKLPRSMHFALNQPRAVIWFKTDSDSTMIILMYVTFKGL